MQHRSFTMDENKLYPPIEPYDVRQVPVDNLHTVHVEQSGNPDGVPVVHLHGGPGGPWSPHIRRFFDPAHYRLIAFDQRGAWRSTPLGELRQNTPDHLVADMERLREMFGIEKWIVFGGSWGSTLALAYAEANPDRCLALVVRGISFGRCLADGWYFSHSRWIRPAAWARLMEAIPEGERDAPEEVLARRIRNPDPAIALPAIQAWNDHANMCGVTHHQDPDVPPHVEESEAETLAAGRLSIHYMVDHVWQPPDDLLSRATHLRGMPGAIIHGEEDFNCPPSNAWDLAEAWPDAELHMIPDAGHSCFDSANRAALVATMERLKSLG
jgi:proline iminopeptidase